MTGFDWDSFFRQAGYLEIQRLSPELSRYRHPSCFSPDRQWFYISTQDFDVETSDEEALLNALQSVKATYHQLVFSNERDLFRRGRVHNDFLVLCDLLAAVAADPSPYRDPDALLLESSTP